MQIIFCEISAKSRVFAFKNAENIEIFPSEIGRDLRSPRRDMQKIFYWHLVVTR